MTPDKNYFVHNHTLTLAKFLQNTTKQFRLRLSLVVSLSKLYFCKSTGSTSEVFTLLVRLSVGIFTGLRRKARACNCLVSGQNMTNVIKLYQIQTENICDEWVEIFLRSVSSDTAGQEWVCANQINHCWLLIGRELITWRQYWALIGHQSLLRSDTITCKVAISTFASLIPLLLEHMTTNHFLFLLTTWGSMKSVFSNNCSVKFLV